ncbi:MAG: class I SAM-dependent methyltransferase [Holophagaceae bacterium]|uniref:Class I SAM-dependent methyltransferase n=1 Tax=Candidatus Geothrix skivensis TaxID=2954439 RepID=A0A9D7SGA9_9BACT|nr:class I SAM-dependent methyltransferase [Candidatus Geothrix skivensis]
MNPRPPFPSMPFMEPFTPLLRLFQGMTRKGPGSEASTLRALALCPLPPHPAVADLGCGSGASALLLARTLQPLQTPILALDADGTALDDLWESAQAQGLLSQVKPCSGDMANPDIPPGSLDLLWSEGSIGHLGWAEGLRIWRNLLRPGGVMAFTDATWFEDNPPSEARRAWGDWYPTMGTEEANLRTAMDVGLDVLGHFRLPSQDWWDYFDQAEARCQKCDGDESLAETIAGMRGEMNLYRHTGHSYGYVFYILQKA